jgi:Niemann-Pick C1 protein
MGIWHISLNAISLVNLSIAIGIGVEFCTHIARAFMGAGAGGGAGLPHSHPAGRKERDDRAYAALIDVGSSVFSGITLTKLIGISVLALTRSKLLEVRIESFQVGLADFRFRRFTSYGCGAR